MGSSRRPGGMSPRSPMGAPQMQQAMPDGQQMGHPGMQQPMQQPAMQAQGFQQPNFGTPNLMQQNPYSLAPAQPSPQIDPQSFLATGARPQQIGPQQQPIQQQRAINPLLLDPRFGRFGR